MLKVSKVPKVLKSSEVPVAADLEALQPVAADLETLEPVAADLEALEPSAHMRQSKTTGDRRQEDRYPSGPFCK